MEATARLVKLNKERAVLRAQGKLPPVQRKKKTKTIIQELPKEIITPEPEISDCECEADVSSQSSLSDDNDENYNYHCDDGGAEGVEDVYTEPPELTLEPEPEPEPVKIVIKHKRKRRVYK